MNRNEITYLDDNDKVVDKSDATRAIGREYDSEGNLVEEIFFVNEMAESEDEDETMELTQEQIDFIKSLNLNASLDELNYTIKR